jgi:hypothetical protein
VDGRSEGDSESKREGIRLGGSHDAARARAWAGTAAGEQPDRAGQTRMSRLAGLENAALKPAAARARAVARNHQGQMRSCSQFIKVFVTLPLIKHCLPKNEN